MNPIPQVSVIVPTRNRPHLLELTLSSIANQTFSDFEVLVIDDGSELDPTSLVAKFGPRFRCLRQSAKWASAARNLGIAAARGAFIAFIDDDDLWLPEHLEQGVGMLSAMPHYGWRCCSGSYFFSDGSIVHAPQLHSDTSLREALRKGNIILSPSVLVTKELAIASGGFIVHPRIRHGEDWHFWATLSELAPGLYSPQRQVLVRRHPGNLSRIRSEADFRRQAFSLGLLTTLLARRFWITATARRRSIYAWHLYHLTGDALHQGYRSLGIRLAARALAAWPFRVHNWLMLVRILRLRRTPPLDVGAPSPARSLIKSWINS
jgi:glycosyltransferase involved in cell wall biosynthesis